MKNHKAAGAKSTEQIYAAGDFARVVLADEVIEGTILPSQNKDIMLVKLESGYNLGIDSNKVNEITVLKKKAPNDAEHHKLHHDGAINSAVKDSGMKTICILHCGGTIASRVDYSTGAVSAAYSPDEIIKMFPELSELANIKSKLIANIMSDNIRFSHYNIIAKEIEKQANEGVDGIIITQGTDTLHYTSAALSFMLHDIQIPVIITGAQRSSDRGSTDAAFNLVSAANFIANSDFAGVAVCLHDYISDEWCAILSGTKVRKMHTSRRDAFRPINTVPIARVNIMSKQIEFNPLYKKQAKGVKTGGLQIKYFREDIKVGIVKAHPNMWKNEISCFEHFDGLVLEGTGLGHFPIINSDEHTGENAEILAEIKKLSKKMPVVMAPQTIWGRINMNVYSPGRELIDAGVLGNFSDMTPETAFIKLAWLISNYPPDEVRALFGKNIAGELSERTGADFTCSD